MVSACLADVRADLGRFDPKPVAGAMGAAAALAMFR
jgi:hypothetical protein